MNDGIFIFGLLVIAYVIGMIVSMAGSDKVIEDLYGLPPVDKKANKYLKKKKTYGI